MHDTDADPEDQTDQTDHQRDQAGAGLPRVGNVDNSLGDFTVQQRLVMVRA